MATSHTYSKPVFLEAANPAGQEWQQMEMEPRSHWNSARAALLGLASFHCFLSLLNHLLLFCDFYFMLTALLVSPHLPPPHRAHLRCWQLVCTESIPLLSYIPRPFSCAHSPIDGPRVHLSALQIRILPAPPHGLPSSLLIKVSSF